MYFWNKYPFVRFVLAYMLGIICFTQFPQIWNHAFYIPIALLSSSALIIAIAERKGYYYRTRHLTGFLALISLFYFGGIFTKIKYHQLPENHYRMHHPSHIGFVGTVASYPNERTNYFRYDFSLSHVIFARDSLVPSVGNIHLYVRKDSITKKPVYGDQLAVKGRFFEVPGPDNPEEFDFQKYLARQGVYSQAFVSHSDLQLIGNEHQHALLGLAFKMRGKAAAMLTRHFPDPREHGIAEALLLGIKDHLDEDIKRAYSAAGAMHVLAVSGLHVGIIYLLIRLLFGRIKRMGRWGRLSFAGLSMLAIWFYALVTGMSPSVLRAATMFSLIIVTQTFAKQSNVYNTLAFTAFLLLLIDPYLLYSVGFQLSFVAVLGIVYIQPKLYQLWAINHYVLDKVWAITCVSLAAQLATFPLTAYYFHQFPTYFLVSNLVVIPAAFLLLTGGLVLLLFDWVLPAIAVYPRMALNQLLKWVNGTISMIEALPRPIIDWIYLDFTSLFLIYLAIITSIAGFQFRTFKTLIVATGLLLILFTHILFAHEQQSRKEEVIIYHINDNLAIDHIAGHQATLHLDGEEPASNFLSYQVDPYRRASFLSPIRTSTKTLKDSGFQKKDALKFGWIGFRRFVIIDSTTFHLDFVEMIETDVLIIQNEAVKSLDWLDKHFTSDVILLANGNSWWYIQKMKQSAAKLHLNIHATKSDGALILSQKGTKKERTRLPALFTTNPD